MSDRHVPTGPDPGKGLRWTGRSDELVLPTVQDTLDAMDQADVDIALLSAWHGPDGPLISNAAPRRDG